MATKIVDAAHAESVKYPDTARAELMVAEAKMLCTEIWPDDFGDLAPQFTAELKAAQKELRLCQLRALLDKEFGKVPGDGPKLRLIQGGLSS
jgi:hypothetical protein